MSFKAINIQAMKINAIGRASRISFGHSSQHDLTVKNKKNQGFGDQNADACLLFHTNSAVDDSDKIDSTSFQRERKPTNQ